MSRARLAGLSLLCVAFAAYGSFVPLRLRPIGLTEGLRLALEIPSEPVWHIFNGDFFTNVLVFLPIGFFAAGAITQRERPEGTRSDWTWNLGLVFVGSAAVSLLIEFGQVFVRDRTPSWSDVYAQAVGGFAGAALWMVAGPATIRWVAGSFDGTSSREQRVLRLLALYVAGWTLYALLPTLFPLLAHPQLFLWRAQLDLSGLVLAGPVIIAGLSTGPVGAWAALLSARLRATWAGGLLLVTGVGLLIVADRVRQVGLTPTDGHLASSIVGFSCGWLLTVLGIMRAARWSSRTTRVLLLAALSGIAFVIALQYWAPFDFGVSQQALDQRVRVLYTRAPFHRYYWLPPLVALGEVTTLALLSMGTSVLVALTLRARHPRSSWRAPVLVTILFSIVEWGQLYLPSRRADPTDVLIAIAGAWLGSAIVRALGDASAAKATTT